MRIFRNGERRTHGLLLDCRVYIRKDFVAAAASEWYYEYVGENSYLPLCDLLLPEDAEILKSEIENLTEPVELLTRITNRREEGYRNVYLRMENCERTENGKPLYLITLMDILDLEARLAEIGHVVAKYRHFMTLKNEYYFEYTLPDNLLVIYKYINQRSLKVVSEDLDDFAESFRKEGKQTKEQEEQMQTFCNYLKSGNNSFEMNFTVMKEEESSLCGVKGGTFYRDPDMVAGVFNLDSAAESEAYYLTPAAKDAGTGLLNKRAATEYAIEKLQSPDTKNCWILIMDIDDFKNINDSFGHLFGDEVIRFVADTLKTNVGSRGIVGRFGGDEFFMLLDRIDTREKLKVVLKTIVKQLANAFDMKVRITASIGVSQYPKDGDTLEELFEKADKSLYIAKQKGKNRHIIYDEKMHGAYTKDCIQTQAVSYALSREKRREVLSDVISNIYKQGAEYVTQRPEIQKNIRDLFDVDGFAVYTDYGKKVLCRNGDYVCEAPDTGGELTEETYLALFGKEDVLIETSTVKLKTRHPDFYQIVRKQEIGATLRCIVRKNGEPFAMIHFDVFNRNRKWSEMDIEMLYMIGNSLGNKLCEE